MQRHELTEPFAALLDTRLVEASPDARVGVTDTAVQTDQDATDGRGPEDVLRPVFSHVTDDLDIGNGGQNETPPGEMISVGWGVSKQVLVDLTSMHKNSEVLADGPEAQIKWLLQRSVHD